MCVNLFKFGICWVHWKMNKNKTDERKCTREWERLYKNQREQKKNWNEKERKTTDAQHSNSNSHACPLDGETCSGKKYPLKHLLQFAMENILVFCWVWNICNLKIILINFTYRKAKRNTWIYWNSVVWIVK